MSSSLSLLRKVRFELKYTQAAEAKRLLCETKLSERTEMRQSEAEWDASAKVIDTIAYGEHVDTPTITVFVAPPKCDNVFKYKMMYQYF